MRTAQKQQYFGLNKELTFSFESADLQPVTGTVPIPNPFSLGIVCEHDCTEPVYFTVEYELASLLYSVAERRHVAGSPAAQIAGSYVNTVVSGASVPALALLPQNISKIVVRVRRLTNIGAIGVGLVRLALDIADPYVPPGAPGYLGTDTRLVNSAITRQIGSAFATVPANSFLVAVPGAALTPQYPYRATLKSISCFHKATPSYPEDTQLFVFINGNVFLRTASSDVQDVSLFYSFNHILESGETIEAFVTNQNAASNYEVGITLLLKEHL